MTSDTLPQTQTGTALPRFHTLREPVGVLDLQVKTQDGRSVAGRRYHEGALRLMRAHYLDDSGQVYYTIINPGGAYFGGDDYHFKIQIEENASLLLTGQSATKVYKTPDDYSLQDFEVELGPGAVFEYIPDQLIAYEDATYAQHMNVQMDPTASLLTAEIVTPGWAPDGSLFKFDEVRMRTAVQVGGELALVDNLLVRPGDGSFTDDSLLFLEDQTHFATLIAVDQHIDGDLVKEIRELMAEHQSTYKHKVLDAITLTDGPGLAVRAIGTYTEDLYSLIIMVANELRRRFRGQGPLELRKY